MGVMGYQFGSSRFVPDRKKQGLLLTAYVPLAS
jgi:hypothetical protein